MKTTQKIAPTALLAGIMAFGSQAAAEPGSYPNFSGAGVHNNPAVFPEYGNWGYLELGGNQEQQKTTLKFSNKVGEDIQIVGTAAAVSEENNAAVFNLKIALPAFGGLNVGADATTAVQSKKADFDGSFGLVKIFRKENFLARIGIQQFAASGATRVGAEIRGSVSGIELTGSANTDVKLVGAEKGYNGQHVGAQFKAGNNLFSLGNGGKGIRDWQEMNLHYRRFISKNTTVDTYFNSQLQRNFIRKPAYVGAGITRRF